MPHKETIDFSPLKNLACLPRQSHSEKSKVFQKFFHQYDSVTDLKDQLISFLDQDACLSNYYHVYLYTEPGNKYTDISDFGLAEHVLLQGLRRVAPMTNEESKYGKCSLLWGLSLLYFRNNKLPEAKQYADSATAEKELMCGSMFPALDSTECARYEKFLGW